MTTNPMFAQARRQPLSALADALALLEAKPKLDKTERLTRAVLMEVICEKSPAADAAFKAWAEDDDAPADGAVAAILAAVQGQPARPARVDKRNNQPMMRNNQPTIWTYKGVNVFPAGPNSAGIRWYARVPGTPVLEADTKQSMCELITRSLAEGGAR
jgi:hypothetical protein